ncbi:Phospholipase B1, membrane-associated [Harpegnathos saltator]|uniref:Phospholipase B1, membrane-associated n=1 Tax=Harpegnathos saltator TaxID=610380 RepID=E2C7G0_HARSA|nr:Phospholipase B1, membrane-associated [Harpegnathos saltator]
MWKRWQLFYVLLHLCADVSTEKTDLDSPFNLMLLRTFRNWTFDAFGRTGTEGGKDIKLARDSQSTQQIVPDYIPFPCNVTGGRSQEVPDSIHELRPGDIDVIAAMGDSLTAGTGIFAHNLFQVIIENRGVAAFGGGQGTWRQYLTLPNIIKEFNHNLIGYAKEDSLTIHEASQLNVAESGAMSEDMPYMAEVLVKRIKSDPRINVEKDWKLISLMIGDNDFCTNICWTSSPWSILEKHKADMIEVLTILRDNLPRTFVSQKYQSLIQEYYNIIERWQELDIEISTYPQFHTDDFTVVAQPITLNLFIPPTADGSPDMTYFSSDCFHVTQKVNALISNAVWNNLLEPVGAKAKYSQKLFDKFLCPAPERPYLATMRNSTEQK